MWNNMPYGDGGYGLMHGGGYWLGMGLHGVFWIVLVAVIAVMVIWAVRSGRRQYGGAAAGGGPNPREILDARYARGEIEQEEYLTRKKTLEN
ncbi:MAG: SHOCT domain-containing protein [Alphaproteobacteria bacterium]|nr:SHOCT domain-containing protein [Alphaproteobacteria bacterium]